MSNILILECGTQGMIMSRDIQKSGHQVFLYGEKNYYADSSRYVKKFYECKYTPSDHNYLDSVIDIIKDNAIETVLPMGDAQAEFLSKNKNVLLQFVSYLMPDIKDFERGVDKNKLMALCNEKCYPHPLTINSVEDITLLDKEKLPFPLLIKPNITCGGRGMTLVHNYNELKDKYPFIREEYGGCHLQQYVKQGGAQVEIQLYVDEEKRLVQSSVIYKYRWYPEKGGSSCCAKSVKNDKIVDILYHLLLDLNWQGFADFDTIEDPDTGELLIMELNPRVPACVKCPIEAGIHWGEIIVNGYMGKPQKKYDYIEGEYLRHLGFEILWFLKSPNRFRTKPNWFNLIGKHIHYQDMNGWTDPIPFIMGTLRNIRKVLSHTEKKKIER